MLHYVPQQLMCFKPVHLEPTVCLLALAKTVWQPFVSLLQVRRSPQGPHAVPHTLQHALDDSPAAQLAADRAAAELIAEEQTAAIRHQQACSRAAHTKAKKQELRRNSQEGSQDHHTVHNKGTSVAPSAHADGLAATLSINIDAMVCGLAHNTPLQQQAQDNSVTFMQLQSAGLQHPQDSPQTDVTALCLDATYHKRNNLARLDTDLHWVRQAGCLDRSDLRHADEEQLMQQMLCCPLTKVKCKLCCGSLLFRRTYN